MIHSFETKLASNLTLAISLTDAEKFHRDHEDIKPFVDVRPKENQIQYSMMFFELFSANLRTNRSFTTKSRKIDEFLFDK